MLLQTDLLIDQLDTFEICIGVGELILFITAILLSILVVWYKVKSHVRRGQASPDNQDQSPSQRRTPDPNLNHLRSDNRNYELENQQSEENLD